MPFLRALVFLSLPALICVSQAGAEDGAAASLQIRGQGWTQMGRVMHVTDTLGGTSPGVNLNGNWQQSSGAQFTAVTTIGDNLEGALGFGGYQVYHSEGNAKQQRPMRSIFQNYITEARMTYFQGEKNAPAFSLTFGDFAYNYNPDVKNLGLYLLRGPVYPGYLMSGFKDFKTDTTKGNIFGARFHHALRNFQQDLIFANERDLPPTFDWSVAYVAKYKVVKGVELGGGVNFYRLIPNDSKLETVVYDSVSYSNQGTKLMAMFNADFKRWFPINGMGPHDLKLYGETSILGVENQGSFYNDIWQRIPVMIGFNIPTFGWLDYFSLEVEWYGSKYRNTLDNIGNFNTLCAVNVATCPASLTSDSPSPLPVSNDKYYHASLDSLGRVAVAGDTLQVKGTRWDVENQMSDNWKWSLYAEKTVLGHISFIGQVANDHFRPRPAAINNYNESGGLTEAFSSPKDWYWMFRIGYFF